MKGKCGGGKKKLGVSYNFETEEAFLKHIRKLCAGCYLCGTIGLKKSMIRVGGNHYACRGCYPE